MFVERRETQRETSTERGAVIVEGIRRFCDITDISHKGARLRLGADAPLPLRFMLIFADGSRVYCQRVWQEERVAGVQFSHHPLWRRLISPLG